MQCNCCALKKYKKAAKEQGNRIILKPSNFMGGICVFTVPKGEKLPEYTEPTELLPNGDKNYQEHVVSWMKEIPEQCAC